MQKISEKAVSTDLHSMLCVAIEAFARIAPSTPKVSLSVVQNIYGRFDDALYGIFRAENTFDAEEKITYLIKAKDAIFFQFTSIELLVKNHSITIGQANEVITLLRDCHADTSKWLKSVVKNK